MGGEKDSDRLRKYHGKKKKFKPGSHKDSVTSVSLNKFRKFIFSSHSLNTIRNILASSSNDSSVKIWDLQKGICVKTFKKHKGEVNKIEWNYKEDPILMSAGND